MEAQKLPCKIQPGDPVIFAVNENCRVNGHIAAVKFTDNGEILYDLRVYPIESKWTEFHLQLNEVPSAFVEEAERLVSLVENRWNMKDFEDWLQAGKPKIST
jgi:hypothetical protein